MNYYYWINDIKKKYFANIMELNNKFGTCCKCPALNNGGFLGTYIPRRDYNMYLMKTLGTSNSHNYRDVLINKGSEILNIQRNVAENNLACKNTNENIFYDRPNINEIFDSEHIKRLSKTPKLETKFMLLQ